MNDYRSMDWKVFTIRLIETARWPIFWAIAIFLLRQPIGRLIDQMVHKLAG